MTITKGTIITAVNDEIKTVEDTATVGVRAARAIRAGLRWISQQGLWTALHTTAPSTTSAGTATVVRPADFRVIDTVVVNDGSEDSEPLDEITYRQFLVRREGEGSGHRGEPGSFAQRGGYLHLHPVPDDNGGANYTVYVRYWRYHPDQDVILFGGEFEQAVNDAVTAAYLDGKGRHEKAQYYLVRAAEQCRRLAVDGYTDIKIRRDRIKGYGQ